MKYIIEILLLIVSLMVLSITPDAILRIIIAFIIGFNVDNIRKLILRRENDHN